jgi:hypothetical protein
LEEKSSFIERPAEAAPAEEAKERPLEEENAEIITFVPGVRLRDFQVSLRGCPGVLSLHLGAAGGEEKIEIVFPSEEEKAISKAMEQMLLPRV